MERERGRLMLQRVLIVSLIILCWLFIIAAGASLVSEYLV